MDHGPPYHAITLLNNLNFSLEWAVSKHVMGKGTGKEERMGVQLHIPDSVVQAIRLPEKRIRQELLVELAFALYAQGFLSFGKARELADMSKYEFGQLLGKRGITRHYGQEELEDDLSYVRSE
jgi:predicted HTH domain antitoxin